MKPYNENVEMEAMSQFFLSRLYRFDCPPALELADWESDLLDTSQASRVAHHVQHCPRCRQDLQEMRDFVSTMQIPQPVTSFLSPVRRVIQAIQIQAFSGSLAGARGTDDGTRFYQVENVEVTLQVNPDPKAYGKRFLSGLVAMDGEAPPSGSEVSIGNKHTPLDEIGNFELNQIQPGSYQITIHLPEVDVQINNVAL